MGRSSTATRNPKLGLSYHVKNENEIMILNEERKKGEERHTGEMRESGQSKITKVLLWPTHTYLYFAIVFLVRFNLY